MPRARRRRVKRRTRRIQSKQRDSPVPEHWVARYGQDNRKTRLLHWWQFYQELKHHQF